jgi:alkaline phosphatase
MINHNLAPKSLQLLIAVALGTISLSSIATPTISRLTPPSNPAFAGANTLARFLPGQRFDLQATVRPEAGMTITAVNFAVDGVTIKVPAAHTSMVPATAITAKAPSAIAASLRAYSNTTVGVHTLTATATQSDGSTTTATGRFEVMPILTNQGRVAKNVILLLGDGMGAAHRTAARIMVKGYAQGMSQGRLAMDTFPFTGMVMTSSLNSIVTDSAPGMSNYVTGNKADNNQEGVFPDDTTDAFDNPRVEYLSEYLHRTKGKSLGIVTTADVFDATPAANAVHTSNRGRGTGIVDQYLDDRTLTGLKVLMGGGRKWFIPKKSTGTAALASHVGNGSARSASSDYVLPSDLVAAWGAAPGSLDPDRDLISDFQAAGYTYAADKTALDAAGVPDKLLGLFSYSNMNVAFDKIGKRRGTSTVVDDYGFPDQPMLDEMAAAAIKVLNKKNDKGFYLMIEGASIDKQSHLMDADRFIEETIEFDRAVKVAQDFAATHADTLVIVTADHECAGVGIIGTYTGSGAPSTANVAVYEAAAFPKYTILADGYPQTTDIPGKMLIGYAGNADRYETWKASVQPAQDSQQPFIGQAPLSGYPTTELNKPTTRNASTGFLITGQVPGDQGVHTATDIPLSAYGRGAQLFSGVIDNTDVFFKIGQAVFGGVKMRD